jgi:raffinose/stachyose/melibiose transport system substrate-binding protein
MFTKSYDAWNAANPNRQIAYEVYANDAYKEKIRTAIGAGEAPTLVWSWGAFGVVDEYVAAKQIISLDGKVDQALSRVLPSVADAGKLDGVQVAVPNGDAQPVMLFYNKDLFKQAGVEAPIKTWDDLLAAIPKFKAIGVAPFSLAGGSKWPDLMWLEYLADRIGGPGTFNDVVAGKANAWSSPAMLDALTHIQDLVKADGFQSGFTSTAADSHADVALVYSGKAAMILQGSWVYGTFKADTPDFVSGGKLGSFPFPAVSGGTGDPSDIAGNPSNFFSIAASANAEEQQIALDWLNQSNLDGTMVDTLIAGGGVPPVANALDKLKASDDASFLVDAYNLLLNAKHFQASWDQVLSSTAAQELLTNLDMIFQGQITPQEFADNMNKTLS